MAKGVFERSTYELHPDGPVVLTLRDYDGPKDGKYGPQVCWKFDSEEEMESGELFDLHHWTGIKLSSDSRNKLNKLLTAFGLDTEELEVEELDLDDLIGKRVNAMIVHTPNEAGQDRAVIDSMTQFRKKKADGSSGKAAATAKATASPSPWGDDD